LFCSFGWPYRRGLFALPLFDIFKFFRVKEKIKNLNGQLIKLMKVYVASHFPVMPVNAFFYWLVLGPYGTEALSLLGISLHP